MNDYYTNNCQLEKSILIVKRAIEAETKTLHVKYRYQLE